MRLTTAENGEDILPKVKTSSVESMNVVDDRQATDGETDVNEAFFVETEALSFEPEAKTKMFMSRLGDTEALSIPAEESPRPRPSELEIETRPRPSCVVQCLELLQLHDFPIKLRL